MSCDNLILALRCRRGPSTPTADAKAGVNSGGTGFLLGQLSTRFPKIAQHKFVVSNWHVAVAGGYSVVRVNTHGGEPDIFKLDPHEWYSVTGGHDVAMALLPVNAATHRVIVADAATMITREEFAKYGIGLGEDVFMMGRFVDHDGGKTNTPTVRFGNISMLPAPIKNPETGRTLETYCLDMRSRSGYSGSPVFVYRTAVFDLVDGKPVRAVTTQYNLLLLLGVHIGQFPELWEIVRGRRNTKVRTAPQKNQSASYVKGLSGMTCVAPAWAIKETIEMTKLKDLIAAADDQTAETIAQQGLPFETEVAEPARPPIEGDEQHKERFTALLDAAVGKPRQGG